MEGEWEESSNNGAELKTYLSGALAELDKQLQSLKLNKPPELPEDVEEALSRMRTIIQKEKWVIPTEDLDEDEHEKEHYDVGNKEALAQLSKSFEDERKAEAAKPARELVPEMVSFLDALDAFRPGKFQRVPRDACYSVIADIFRRLDLAFEVKAENEDVCKSRCAGPEDIFIAQPFLRGGAEMLHYRLIPEAESLLEKAGGEEQNPAPNEIIDGYKAALEYFLAESKSEKTPHGNFYNRLSDIAFEVASDVVKFNEGYIRTLLHAAPTRADCSQLLTHCRNFNKTLQTYIDPASDLYKELAAAIPQTAQELILEKIARLINKAMAIDELHIKAVALQKEATVFAQTKGSKGTEILRVVGNMNNPQYPEVETLVGEITTILQNFMAGRGRQRGLS